MARYLASRSKGVGLELLERRKKPIKLTWIEYYAKQLQKFKKPIRNLLIQDGVRLDTELSKRLQVTDKVPFSHRNTIFIDHRKKKKKLTSQILIYIKQEKPDCQNCTLAIYLSRVINLKPVETNTCKECELMKFMYKK